MGLFWEVIFRVIFLLICLASTWTRTIITCNSQKHWSSIFASNSGGAYRVCPHFWLRVRSKRYRVKVKRVIPLARTRVNPYAPLSECRVCPILRLVLFGFSVKLYEWLPSFYDRYTGVKAVKWPAIFVFTSLMDVLENRSFLGIGSVVEVKEKSKLIKWGEVKYLIYANAKSVQYLQYDE